MTDRDKRGYGSGIGKEYHNDPESHYRKIVEERQETTNRDRLYTDITECEAVVISDRGGEYGGTTDREVQTDQSGTTTYTSVIIRFIGPSDNPSFHPDQAKKDPLSAKNKEEFLQLRSLNSSRAVKEPMLFGLIGEPEIGNIVRCVKRGNIWEINAVYERSHQPYDDFINRMANPTADSGKATYEAAGSNGVGAPGSSSNQSTGRTSSRGGVPKTIENPASNCEVPVEGRALLDMIAYNESRGKYNIRYGGDQSIEITDFSDHPRKAEKITRGYNTGLRSSAAGRYQFITGTWDSIANQEGLTDFTPASQDKAAWALAKRDYKARTGRDLMRDLKSGTPADLNRIGRSLSKTWTSLPGSTSGEELTSDSQFVEGYNNLLSNQQSADTCPDKSFS